jgi:hypothetical protein
MAFLAIPATPIGNANRAPRVALVNVGAVWPIYWCASRVLKATMGESVMKRGITIVSLSLGLSLVIAGHAVAQETINADGSSGAANSGTNPAVNADGPTVIYGDLGVGPAPTINVPVPGTNITASDGNATTRGPGNASAAPGTVNGGVPGASLLGPDGTYSVSDSPPSDVSVGDSGALAPAPEPAVPVDDTAAAPADTSTATSTDLDGDNYPDAQELEVGLDPANIDTDGDGVADGDELNIYGTDPLTWDSDGDGQSDGAELYDSHTDPLVWDDTSGAAVEGGSQESVGTDVEAADTGSGGTAVDSDGDRLGDADEAALGTDPNTSDSDGDGYYDGDEANLGTDPLDPASVPAT